MPSPVAGEYWLIHPTDTSQSIRLSNVITDEYTEEYEEATLLVINKGRKKDYGQRWGYKGSLSAQVWDEPGMTARQSKAALETLRGSRVAVGLQTPFGDTWVVAINSVSIGRIAGVGPREFHNLALEYEEVY